MHSQLFAPFVAIGNYRIQTAQPISGSDLFILTSRADKLECDIILRMTTYRSSSWQLSSLFHREVGGWDVP